MKAYIKSNLQAYEATAAEFQAKIQGRRPDVLQFVATVYPYVPPQGRILELGPGSGDMARLLAKMGWKVTALELSPAMARLAAERAPQANIMTREFLEYRFGAQSFDAIIAMAFIHLFPPPDNLEAARKIAALLTAGGHAFISTTKHSAESDGYDLKHNFSSSKQRYRKRYTKESLQNLLEKASFKVVAYNEVDDLDSGRTWMEFVCRKRS